ncbi:MAG: DUF5343 domain-containing protein [Acidobacteriota bacterium]
MPDDRPAAAYVSYKTLENALDRLSEGLPSKVDKSAFENLSGSSQSQLISSMKFLRLIGDEHEPAPILKELVSKNELERKSLLRKVFEDAYAEIFALDIKKATPAQVKQIMAESYGVSGTTLLRSMRFLLQGLEAMGIEVSPYLKETKTARPKKSTPNGKAKSKSKAQAKPKAAKQDEAAEAPRKSKVPEGFARQEIPTLNGAYIVYPVDMTEQDFALFEAALAFMKAVVQR